MKNSHTHVRLPQKLVNIISISLKQNVLGKVCSIFLAQSFKLK